MRKGRIGRSGLARKKSTTMLLFVFTATYGRSAFSVLFKFMIVRCFSSPCYVLDVPLRAVYLSLVMFGGRG